MSYDGKTLQVNLAWNMNSRFVFGRGDVCGSVWIFTNLFSAHNILHCINHNGQINVAIYAHSSTKSPLRHLIRPITYACSFLSKRCLFLCSVLWSQEQGNQAWPPFRPSAALCEGQRVSYSASGKWMSMPLWPITQNCVCYHSAGPLAC